MDKMTDPRVDAVYEARRTELLILEQERTKRSKQQTLRYSITAVAVVACAILVVLKPEAATALIRLAIVLVGRLVLSARLHG